MIFCSVVMAYYDNPNMFRRQLDSFLSLGFDLKERLQYVVVDDCSPKWPAFDVVSPLLEQDKTLGGIPFSLFRMKVDIRWNQDACRNLGAHHSRHPWVLLTDIDHMIPERTMRKLLLHENLQETYAYRFSRVDDRTFEPYKPHPNSWLMTKSIYDAADGYDERFAGWYGTDGDFRNRVMAVTNSVRQLPLPLIRVGREHTADASCPREFGRKDARDTAMVARIKADRPKGYKTVRLSFPFEQLV